MWRKQTPVSAADAPLPRRIPTGPLDRPAWARPRGEHRSHVLAVEAAEQNVTSTIIGQAMSEQLNAGLLAAGEGLYAEAAEHYAAVVAMFDASTDERVGGYHHDYPLQAGTAIALVRWADAARRLGDFETALTCLERCHTAFRAATEEQGSEEDWWARQWAAEAALRRGDLLAELGRHEEARAQWSVLLPTSGLVWPSLMDWADEAIDRFGVL